MQGLPTLSSTRITGMTGKGIAVALFQSLEPITIWIIAQLESSYSLKSLKKKLAALPFYVELWKFYIVLYKNREILCNGKRSWVRSEIKDYIT